MRELYRGMVHQPDLTPASLELSANGVYDARHRIHRDRDIHPPTRDLLTDDEYADLQNVLVENPERGDIITGSGGLRKLRFALPGPGRSGGARVIYYWLRNDGQIYMLLIYPKSTKDDLTDLETALLREFVKEL